MRFALIALSVGIGCSFNEVKTSAPQAGPPILFGEAISAEVAPVPIAGGTLLVTKSNVVVAANPDKGTVEVFDLKDTSPGWTASLGEDSEPGRMIEDDRGNVLVVLRRAGEIA